MMTQPSDTQSSGLSSESLGTPSLRDALVPVNAQILTSDGVETALERLQAAGTDYILVTDPIDGPIGLITREDIEQLQWKHPDYWAAMRCGNAVSPPARFIHPAASFDAAVDMFKDEGVRPLLVVDSGAIVGVLEPTAVFQWCAEYWPAALEELAQLARAAEPRNQ